jgi:hypothetical protein
MRISKVIGVAVAATLAAVAAVALVHVNRASSGSGQSMTNVVDPKGNLRVPANYRTLYQSVGTWAIAADSGRGSKEMHEVYASPGTIEAFRSGGRFPDGAVLVKEVFGTSTMGMTTGIVSHAATLKGWFVMVKDGRNSHPGNPLWGDGWGWSWFDADQPLKTTSTNYETDCQGCHVPAQSTDWIYVSGYAVLHR